MSNLPSTASSSRFFETLERVRSTATRGPLTLGNLLELFGPNGHALLTLFLVLPFLQPIPLPGLSTIVGLALALIGFFLLRDQAPWLPARLARVHLKAEIILRICLALEHWLLRLRWLIRPRHRGFFRNPSVRIFTGGLFFTLSILLALPLPIPLSNALPGLALFTLALATLEEDAVLYAVGGLVTLVTFAFFVMLALIPYLGIKSLRL